MFAPKKQSKKSAQKEDPKKVLSVFQKWDKIGPVYQCNTLMNFLRGLVWKMELCSLGPNRLCP